jgi:hypothetical protein
VIPNYQMALENVASIKVAVNLTRPDWTMAQKVWEDELDYATLSLFQQLEPGRAPALADPRIGEVRLDIERLHRALKIRDRTTANSLLISIEQKVKVLAA